MKNSTEKKCPSLNDFLKIQILINTLAVILTVFWAFSPSRFIMTVDTKETFSLGIFSALLNDEHTFIFMIDEGDIISLISNVERILAIVILFLLLFKYVSYMSLYFNDTDGRRKLCIISHVASSIELLICRLVLVLLEFTQLTCSERSGT
ncbi:hypothetical protein RF11_14365 [Thelohanellus kitauei]|uniref:Uncharacterized protein n=1 Tax=Thelohanellus kitauei TaxID=669202 RepID=A0A0C2JWW5_THEKT|nr:hypothetical protein RF11_14365 [Thelohanellus kitauei]